MRWSMPQTAAHAKYLKYESSSFHIEPAAHPAGYDIPAGSAHNPDLPPGVQASRDSSDRGTYSFGRGCRPIWIQHPCRDASFEIFGQVGILYLMFLAAVEIDMFHLKRNLNRGVAFGLITFVIPMAAGIIGSRFAFGSSWTHVF